MLLILPLRWLLAAVIAAMFHELCHTAAVYICQGQIHHLEISVHGAKLNVSELSRPKELLCSLAGPLGGLFLLLFVRWIPRIAVCALFQSFYNLLPLYPLDGGRALWCGTTLFLPENKANKLCAVIEKGCITLIILTAIYSSIVLKLGISSVIPAFFILAQTKIRKTPCKQRS